MDHFIGDVVHIKAVVGRVVHHHVIGDVVFAVVLHDGHLTEALDVVAAIFIVVGAVLMDIDFPGVGLIGRDCGDVVAGRHERSFRRFE